MSRISSGGQLAALAVLLAVLASGEAGTTDGMSLPSLNLRRTTLENGLTVVWEEDRRQPLVAVEVRILGGLRGEGKYLGTGVTHFLEHLLFKGTPSRPPGTIEQEVRRYGGTINAFTSHDFTGVNLFVESRYLREALGMLADILQHANFPEEEFLKEREVVLSEIRMNRDDPDRRIRDLFWNQHLLVHPYRHPILGYQPLLESLTVDDMRAFYQAQYVPNNIVVACVGDLDSAAFPALLNDTFGAWRRGLPYQASVPEEPPAVSVKQAQESLPVQAAYVIFGFPSVRISDPELYPLDVLASIVGQGQSSRLHQELVRTRRVAHVVGAVNYTPLDPGAFTVFLRTDPGGVSPAVSAALEVLERLARDGPSEPELKKAKRQVVADRVFQRQTIESKAADLASSLALTGDPAYSDRYVEGVKQVTKDQAKQAARRWLDRSRMTLVTIEPPGVAYAIPPAAVVDQPRVTKQTLPNGLTVLVGENHQLPMAVIVAAARGGVRAETEQTQGLSNMVAHLLLKGTSRKSAVDIATTVESWGGILAPFSGRDGFGLSLQLLMEDLERGVGLLHELLTDSVVSEPELELQRQLVLKELISRDDDVFDVGSRLLRRTLFAQHPYRFDPMGSPESVSRLTRADCRRFAQERLAAGNLVVSVFGDVQPQQAFTLLQRHFGTLPAGQPAWPATLPADPVDGIRTASASVPKEQAVIMLGFRGTRAVSPDRDTLDVLTTVLSGMSGRLFQAVREQRGLSYTLGAYNVPGWDPGYVAVYAATRPQEREQVLKTLYEELQLLVDQGVTEEELTQAKRYLIGSHRLELQGLGGLAKRSTLDELYGLGYDAWQSYEQRIGAVTAAMVQEAAQRYLQLSHRTEIVVAPE